MPLIVSVTAIVPPAKDRLAMFYLGLAFEDTHIIIIMGKKTKTKPLGIYAVYGSNDVGMSG